MECRRKRLARSVERSGSALGEVGVIGTQQAVCHLYAQVVKPLRRGLAFSSDLYGARDCGA